MTGGTSAPKLCTRKMAAALLSTSVRRVVELEERGELVGVRDGRIVKYRIEEIDAYIERLPANEPRRTA